MEHATDGAVVKLLNTLFFSANLEQLVNCSIDIIKNPIQVYDASYFCLAHTDMRDIDDPIWVLGKVGSNCLYEFATILSHLGTKLLQDSGSRSTTTLRISAPTAGG